MNYRGDKFNFAGYPDPVAFEAIGRVVREERIQSKIQKVYICSPFRGDTRANTANAIRYCRFALKHNRFPVATHIWFPRFMDDNVPAERELALKIGVWLLSQCSEVWVFTDNKITEGMAFEIDAAKRQNKPIKYFRINGGKNHD